jgi:diguanylate cyclase (GGDEF)-like protein
MSLIDERGQEHRDPARSAAALFGAGGLVTAIGLVLPHVTQVDVGGLVIVSAASCAVAVALFLGRSRAPSWVFPWVGLIGTVIVSLGLLFNGERHGGPAGGDEMYYLWIVLWTAYHFSRRALALQVAIIGVAYAVTLDAIDPGAIATSRWISLTGLVVGTTVVVRLQGERVGALIAQLRASAETDPLTGLVNRRGLAVAHARELARSERTGRPFAVIVADLDRFKKINDELGHKAGDRALVEVADLLRSHVRDGDVAARTGGDEFALLLSDADAVLAASVAERLEAAAQQHAALERWPGSLSLGIGVSDEDGASMDELLRHADSRLYRAKRAAHARERLGAAA